MAYYKKKEILENEKVIYSVYVFTCIWSFVNNEMVTKVPAIYCYKDCPEKTGRNCVLHTLLCTLRHMKELIRKKEKKNKERKWKNKTSVRSLKFCNNLSCISFICHRHLSFYLPLLVPIILQILMKSQYSIFNAIVSICMLFVDLVL